MPATRAEHVWNKNQKKMSVLPNEDKVRAISENPHFVALLEKVVAVGAWSPETAVSLEALLAFMQTATINIERKNPSLEDLKNPMAGVDFLSEPFEIRKVQFEKAQKDGRPASIGMDTHPFVKGVVLSVYIALDETQKPTTLRLCDVRERLFFWRFSTPEE